MSGLTGFSPPSNKKIMLPDYLLKNIFLPTF